MPAWNDLFVRFEDAGLSPWAAILAAFLPGLLMLYLKGRFQRWMLDRASKDHAASAEMDAEARERVQIAADRQARADELRADIGDLRSEIAQLRLRLQATDQERRELERDRDRGWFLARVTYGRLTVMWHDVQNLLTSLRLIYARAQIDVPAEYLVSTPPLPPLEEMKP